MKPAISLALLQLLQTQAAAGKKFCTLCEHSSEIPGGHLICNYREQGYPTGINISEVRKRGGLCGWKEPKFFVLAEELKPHS